MSNGLLVVQPNPNPIKLHSALQIFLKYAVVRDEALQAPQLLLEAHGAADVALQPLDDATSRLQIMQGLLSIDFHAI